MQYEPRRTPSGMRDRLQASVPPNLPVRIDAASWYVPQFLPPVSHLTIASDRTVWLRREVEGSSSVEWLRLDAAGGVVGRISLRPDANVLESRGTSVWIAELDEDEPVVSRYTLVPAPVGSRGGR